MSKILNVLHTNIFHLDINGINIHILPMRTWKSREVKSIFQGHTDSDRRGFELSSVALNTFLCVSHTISMF